MAKILFRAVQNAHVSKVIRSAMAQWHHFKSLLVQIEGGIVTMQFSFKEQEGGPCLRRIEAVFKDVFSTNDRRPLDRINHLIEDGKVARIFCNKLAEQNSFEVTRAFHEGVEITKSQAASEFQIVLSVPALSEITKYAEAAKISGLDIRIDGEKVVLGVGDNNTIEEQGNGNVEFKGIPLNPQYKESFHTPTRLMQIATVLLRRFDRPISFSHPLDSKLTRAAVEIAEQESGTQMKGVIAVSIYFH
jgi:hypothetical protein